MVDVVEWCENIKWPRQVCHVRWLCSADVEAASASSCQRRTLATTTRSSLRPAASADPPRCSIFKALTRILVTTLQKISLSLLDFPLSQPTTVDGNYRITALLVCSITRHGRSNLAPQSTLNLAPRYHACGRRPLGFARSHSGNGTLQPRSLSQAYANWSQFFGKSRLTIVFSLLNLRFQEAL